LELGADDQEPGHGVSTMNRSSALDIKSPLERGGDRLRWGVCSLKRVSNCTPFGLFVSH